MNVIPHLLAPALLFRLFLLLHLQIQIVLVLLVLVVRGVLVIEAGVLMVGVLLAVIPIQGVLLVGVHGSEKQKRGWRREKM